MRSAATALDRYLAGSAFTTPSGVIEVEGLRKEYRRLRHGRRRRSLALDGLDLVIPAGGVFGLLGPNGSGKTTTIRCLLGLATPTAGTARLLGADPTRTLHTVIARVGLDGGVAVVLPHHVGAAQPRARGRHHSASAGRRSTPPSIVPAWPSGATTWCARTPSACASASDWPLRSCATPRCSSSTSRPTASIPPASRRSASCCAALVRKAGRWCVSSHLLAEVQHVCDRVAILDRGRCIAAGSVAEVLHLGHAAGLLIRVDEPAAAQAALAAVGLAARASGDGTLLVDLPPGAGADVARALAGAGLYPSELRPQDADLESVFLELTARPSEVQA